MSKSIALGSLVFAGLIWAQSTMTVQSKPQHERSFLIKEIARVLPKVDSLVFELRDGSRYAALLGGQKWIFAVSGNSSSSSSISSSSGTVGADRARSAIKWNLLNGQLDIVAGESALMELRNFDGSLIQASGAAVEHWLVDMPHHHAILSVTIHGKRHSYLIQFQK